MMSGWKNVRKSSVEKRGGLRVSRDKMGQLRSRLSLKKEELLHGLPKER